VLHRGYGGRVNINLPGEKAFRVRKARGHGDLIDFHMPKSDIRQHPAQFVGAAKRKDVLHARHPEARLDRLVQRLVKRVTLDALPDAQQDAAAVGQNPMRLSERGAPIVEEHQRKLAQGQIKSAIREREFLSPAFMPFDCKPLALGRRAGDCEHVRIEIETDDLSIRFNMYSDAPGDDSSPARHVQNTLAGLRVRRLN
jgi:hypothetical protein